MILGATNDADGNLSLMARLRLRHGVLEYKRHRDAGYKILITGGFGAHFNTTDRPHWHYARLFLENELGVPSDAILPEASESANTVEDFEKAAPIFLKYGFARVVLVTSTFHIARARYIASHVPAVSRAVIVTSPAPDDELDAELLAKARAHEIRALEYLKANYPPAARREGGGK